MNKQEVYEFLQAKGVTYEVTEHKAVYNMDELAEVELLYPEANAKNLFVRDDKKQACGLAGVSQGLWHASLELCFGRGFGAFAGAFSWQRYASWLIE